MSTLTVRAIPDFKRALRYARRISRREIPFALARAITDTLFDGRERAVKSWWPRAVNVRNRRFLTAALRVGKATKRRQVGALFDRLQRAAISWQAEGGYRSPVASSTKAIPTRHVEQRLTGTGRVPMRLRTSAPGVYRVDDRLVKDTGRGQNKTRRTLYVLRSGVRQPRTFNFYRAMTKLAAKRLPFHFARHFNRATQRG